MTYGAPSHRPNELSGHFIGMAHRLGLSVCIYQKTGKMVVINGEVLESVGPEHDVDGIE